MKKLFLFILMLIIADVIYAQDTPSGYTTNLRLREYASGANPGADSLNANLEDIDAWSVATDDTITAIKTRVNTVINLGAPGGIIDGTVTYNDLATATKASFMQVTGGQSIAGAKTFTDGMYADGIYPNASETYNLGKKDEMWKTIYVQRVSTNGVDVLNTAGTDSVSISYDGTKVAFDKPVQMDGLTITTDFAMDSAASFNSLKLLLSTVSPSDVADSILTIDSLVVNIRINAPGDMLNVERLDMVGASAGTIVILWSYSLANDITLEDNAPDGNFNLAGNFTIGAGDCITLMYYYDQPELNWRWMEVSRSNN